VPSTLLPGTSTDPFVPITIVGPVIPPYAWTPSYLPKLKVNTLSVNSSVQVTGSYNASGTPTPFSLTINPSLEQKLTVSTSKVTVVGDTGVFPSSGPVVLTATIVSSGQTPIKLRTN